VRVDLAMAIPVTNPHVKMVTPECDITLKPSTKDCFCWGVMLVN